MRKSCRRVGFRARFSGDEKGENRDQFFGSRAKILEWYHLRMVGLLKRSAPRLGLLFALALALGGLFFPL